MLSINSIENEKVTGKVKLELPEKVTEVIKCKNPRCVTSVENNIPNVFYLVDENKGEYRCEYCDDAYTINEYMIEHKHQK